MMDLLLGLDIGTTEVKALTWDADCHCHGMASRKINLIIPQAGWVEQDAEELWDAVIDVCRQAARQVSAAGDQISAIGFSTQGGTTIPVDVMGNPTHLAFSWMDERTDQEAGLVEEKFGQESIYHRTGWPLFPGLPLNQISWFRKNCPSAFLKTARFMFVNDFILNRFGGVPCMDPSNAGITQLYNVLENDWDEELLDFAGISMSQLSPIKKSGEIVSALSEAAAKQTGLEAGIPLMNGAHDQYCAALGSGVVNPGDVLLSCGTAWVLLVIPEDYQMAFRNGFCVSRHAIPQLWGGMHDMGGVGSTVEWLLDQLWADIPDRSVRYQSFNQAALSSPPGANGLIFSPLAGGHSQANTSIHRGCLNLSLNHTRGDIARAAMEGIGLELNWLLDEIGGEIEVSRLKMIGGASRSPIWPQIVADITGLPIRLPSGSGAASLGAAILAAKGIGWDTAEMIASLDNENGVKEILPNLTVQQVYDPINTRYRLLTGARYGDLTE